jgi:uncharacterized RDD family membrane protein YckC
MDIWIIQDGEKTGPIHDYEIRRRIEQGELHADTPAWHEGQADWQPLRTISLFEHEFRKDPFEEIRDMEEMSRSTPPPLPASPQMLRRCFARLLDLNLYSALFWLGLWVSGRDILQVMTDPLVLVPRYIPWFVLECVLIHKFGTTPGKWLLGIRIVNADGSLLDLKASMWRALRVYFLGIGMGLDLMPLICIALTLHFTRKLGRPLWDQSGGHVALVEPLRAGRILTWILLFVTTMAVYLALILPPVFRDRMKNDPEFRKNWEKTLEEIRRDSER